MSEARADLEWQNQEWYKGLLDVNTWMQTEINMYQNLPKSGDYKYVIWATLGQAAYLAVRRFLGDN